MARKKLRNVGRSAGQIRTFNRGIGRRVHELMKQRGATTITLAKAVGVSQAQIGGGPAKGDHFEGLMGL